MRLKRIATVTWHSRIARLEAANAARRAPPALDSVAAGARLISIYTGLGEPITVPVLTASSLSPATPAARRAAEASCRVARIRELVDAAVARQRAEQFADLA